MAMCGSDGAQDQRSLVQKNQGNIHFTPEGNEVRAEVKVHA